MNAFIATVIIVSLVTYYLQNRRHSALPGSRHAGSSHVVDRDRERLFNDLRTRF
jgi:hypothetical protein